MAKKDQVERRWFIIDADGLVLGRLASKIANVLRGKEKPEYTPHVDTGDFVVVVNAEKVMLTGKKEEQKVYRHHTGYPGALREISIKRLREKYPERILREAVKGMMPHNKLSRAMLKKLKIYAGTEHPHEAQNPQRLEL
jgi:large subunit ribosomal protein L13